MKNYTYEILSGLFMIFLVLMLQSSCVREHSKNRLIDKQMSLIKEQSELIETKSEKLISYMEQNEFLQKSLEKKQKENNVLISALKDTMSKLVMEKIRFETLIKEGDLLDLE